MFCYWNIPTAAKDWLWMMRQYLFFWCVKKISLPILNIYLGPIHQMILFKTQLKQQNFIV